MLATKSILKLYSIALEGGFYLFLAFPFTAYYLLYIYHIITGDIRWMVKNFNSYNTKHKNMICHHTDGYIWDLWETWQPILASGLIFYSIVLIIYTSCFFC